MAVPVSGLVSASITFACSGIPLDAFCFVDYCGGRSGDYWTVRDAFPASARLKIGLDFRV